MNSTRLSVAIVSDSSYFPGLWVCLNSLLHFQDPATLRIYVFDMGLTVEQVEALVDYPLSLSLVHRHQTGFGVYGAWECKQQALAYLLRQKVNKISLLIDADGFLVSNIDDVIEIARAGKMVIAQETDHTLYTGGLNTSFFLLDIQKHWPVVGLWHFLSQFANYSPDGYPLSIKGHGDQGVLGPVLATLQSAPHIHIMKEAEWCNCHWGSQPVIPNLPISVHDNLSSCVSAAPITLPEMINEKTRKRQRFLHSSGAKWWKSPQGFQQHAREHGHFLVPVGYFLRQPVPYPFPLPQV